jgi:hypothetical protein
VIARVRLGSALPDGLPDDVRLLGACAAAGIRTPGGVVLLDTSDASDAALAARLGPLPPGCVDLRPLVPVPLGPVPLTSAPVADLPTLAAAVRAALAPGVPVLVQPRVPSVHAGRAALHPGASYDVVRAVEGRADELEAVQCDSPAEVRTLQLPVLRGRWQRPHRGGDPWRTPLPPWGMRLSRLLRAVRAVVGERAGTVEWADDGRVCRLLWLSPSHGGA